MATSKPTAAMQKLLDKRKAEAARGGAAGAVRRRTQPTPQAQALTQPLTQRRPPQSSTPIPIPTPSQSGAIAAASPQPLTQRRRRPPQSPTPIPTPTPSQSGATATASSSLTGRPTHFLALMIDSPNGLLSIKEIQGILEFEEADLKEAMTPEKKLHITCAILRLPTPGDVKKFMANLTCKIQEYIEGTHKPGNINLALEGLGSFTENEIHIPVVPTPKKFRRHMPRGKEEFIKFVKSLKTTLDIMGFPVLDLHRDFKPHVTVCKLTEPIKKKTGMNAIPEYIRKLKLDNPYVGIQQVKGLSLLSMGKGPSQMAYEEIGSITFK